MRQRSTISVYFLGNRRKALPLVASWIYNEWSYLYVGKTVRHVEAFLRERFHTRTLPLTFVAFDGNRPIGTLSLKEFDMPERRDLTPWIASLYVVPDARSRGVGSRLLQAAERKAAGMGFRRLFLFTIDPGLASRFYGPKGWRMKEKTRHQSYPVIVMEKAVHR